jgi:hypothetical protein
MMNGRRNLTRLTKTLEDFLAKAGVLNPVALLVVAILIVGAVLLALLGKGVFTTVLQVSVIAAVVGGIFTIASKVVTSNAKREQFRFEKIYPKQVEVIEKLHGLTVQIETELLSLTSPLQMQGTVGQKTLVDSISEKAKELQKYLSANRIYIAESSADALQSLIDDDFKIWWKWAVSLSSTPPILPNPTEWLTEFDKTDKENKEARKRLESEYRKVFGIA